MKQKAPRSMFLKQFLRSAVVALCVALLAPGDPALLVAARQPQDSGTQQEAPKIPNDQLDSLVAPIALYPDPLLAQVLAASTYPLELVQLQQWLEKHPDLKGQAVTDAVQNEDWDPSVQAMSAFPDVVKQLVEGIKWTTDLGNAFLAQQSDVMDAVQRMRKKAMDAGNLKSSEQQTVETKVVETKTVVVIQQSNPQVIYVPSYNPVVVYGPPVYPYPPIYYPPPSYYAAGVAIAFGVGLAVGSYYRGGWGYYPGWGRSNVNININNNYISHYNKTNINTGNINTGNINRGNINNSNRPSTLPAGGGNTWQHNQQHRGGTPYANQATANKYGGTTRGSSQAARQQSARQQQARPQGGGANRGGTGAQAGARPSQGQLGGSQGGNRSGAGGAQAGTRPSQGQGQLGGGQGANRGSAGGAQAGTANRAGAGGAAGSADRVGNRSVPPSTASGAGGPKATSGGAFNGTSAGGNAARASSSRGASSMGGGGGARGGGGGGRGR